MNKKLELLAPAGDFEKLKVAIHYGCDALYIGGSQYGLRAKAKNFDIPQMAEAIKYAHDRNRRIFVTANIYAHNDDMTYMGDYFKELEKIGADALIISDPGVFMTAKEYVPNMEIHISTQANNTNYKSAEFWYKQGAKRIVSARELSFGEIKTLKENMPDGMELEAFVHGAMCISYSGRCLLSNYLTGRDANKGECAHPCRYKYHLYEETNGEFYPIEEDDRGTYIYNSKDLCTIEHIDKLIESGIDSFKIEGRMKSAYYVGTIVKVYRQAIDEYLQNPSLYYENIPYYKEELTKTSHRKFTTGFYFGKPKGTEQDYETNQYIKGCDFVGMVLSYDNDKKLAKIEQRNKFIKGEVLEVLKPQGKFSHLTVGNMYNEEDEPIEEAPHPQQIVYLETDVALQEFDMLRREVPKEDKVYDLK